MSQPVRSPWALNPPTRTSKPEFFDTPDTARMPAPTTTTAKLYAQRSPAKAAGTRLLIPDYFIRRAGKTIIDAANEGLRQRVLRGKASDLGSNWQLTRNLNFSSDYLNAIQKVTVEVRKFALQDAKYVSATVTRSASVG